MKHIRIFLLVLLTISVFAACRRTADDEIAMPQETAAIHKGEKVIYVGKHPECYGALLFKRLDETFLRATHYPKEALQLQPGDTVYITFQNMQLNDDGIEFATLPIEISEMMPAAQQKTPGLRSE